MEIGLGPGGITGMLDWDAALTTERGTVRLCGFCHISTSGFRVRASRAYFVAFLQTLAPDIASPDRCGRV